MSQKNQNKLEDSVERMMKSPEQIRGLLSITDEPIALPQKKIHIATGPMNLPLRYNYGMISGFEDSEYYMNPLSASAALLDPDWTDYVKELYRDYLEVLIAAKRKYPNRVGTIIIPTLTDMLSTERVIEAIENAEVYQDYKDPRGDLAEEHDRNLSNIYNLLSEKLSLVNEYYGKARDNKLKKIAGYLLQEIAFRSVEVINEVIDDVLTNDDLEVGITREDFLIKGNIGTLYPYRTPSAERDVRYMNHHLATATALAEAGADYVDLNTGSGSELDGMIMAANSVSVPYAISMLTNRNDPTVLCDETERTEVADVICANAENQNFLYAGIAHRRTKDISTSAERGVGTLWDNLNDQNSDSKLKEHIFLKYLASACARCTSTRVYRTDWDKTKNLPVNEKYLSKEIGLMHSAMFATGMWYLFTSDQGNWRIFRADHLADPDYYREFVPMLMQSIGDPNCEKSPKVYLGNGNSDTQSDRSPTAKQVLLNTAGHTRLDNNNKHELRISEQHPNRYSSG